MTNTTELSKGTAESGKEFYIKSVKDGKYLTASSSASGASLTLENFDGSNLQKFTFGTSGGWRTVKLYGTSLYLSTSGDNITLSSSVGTYDIKNFNGGVEYQLRTVSGAKDCGAVAFNDSNKINHQSLGSTWDKTAESKFRWVFEKVSEKGAGEKIVTSAGYTDGGRKTESNTDQRGKTTSYVYDENRLVSTTNPKGQTVTYTYDEDTDQMTSVSSGNATVNYTYNTNGSLKSIAQGGFSYVFTYDPLGRTQKVTVAGRDLVENAYDYDGKISQVSYGNGNTTTYSYDERDQVSSITSTGDSEQSVSYKYDAKGNVIQKLGSHNNYQYLYDVLGRITSYYGRDHKVSIEYDEKNRTVAFTNMVGNQGYTTEYSYNNEKGLIENTKSSSENSVFEKAYTYDELGRMAEYVYNTSNGYTVTYEFLAGSVDGQTTTTTLVKKLNVNGVIYEYTYDDLGNITKVTKGGSEIQSYVYDDLNQLIRENNAETNETVVYTYDNHGNILSKTVYPYNNTSATGETVYYGYDSNWTDLLTSYDGDTITYDQIGNPLNYRDGFSFSWSGGRKLTSVKLDNGSVYMTGEYRYDDNGIRTYKEVNGNVTKYYLDGSTILTEEINYGGATRRIDYVYDENGSVYGFSVGNQKYYYQKNLQGDIIGILDNSGNLLVSYTYTAYGVPTTSFPGITSSLSASQKQEIYILGSNNPFRYRGYYFDTETGFYYLNSRYYDPVTGRFLNADGQINNDTLTGNLFAYCGNNPVKYLDLDGRDAIVAYNPNGETHLGILIEDKDGKWVHFYWGASRDLDAVVSAFIGVNVGTNVVYREYTGEISVLYINASDVYSGTYSKMIRLPGDFSESLDYIKTSYKSEDTVLGYNLIKNNCAQKSLRILARSDTENKEVLLKASLIPVPKLAYNMVENNAINSINVPEGVAKGVIGNPTARTGATGYGNQRWI